MEITSNKKEVIFRKEFEGKVSYSIGLSRKLPDGTYEKGFMPVKFKKGIELKDRTKITIKEAWMDFFKIDKKTIPYIFINKFDMASDFEAIKQVSELPPREKTRLEQDTVEDNNLPFY